MLQLIAYLLVQAGPALPEANVKLRDRLQGPTPVTDKDLRPGKAPDCKTESDIQRALQQLSQGEPGDCYIRDRKFSSSR